MFINSYPYLVTYLLWPKIVAVKLFISVCLFFHRDSIKFPIKLVLVKNLFVSISTCLALTKLPNESFKCDKEKFATLFTNKSGCSHGNLISF